MLDRQFISHRAMKKVPFQRELQLARARQKGASRILISRARTYFRSLGFCSEKLVAAIDHKRAGEIKGRVARRPVPHVYRISRERENLPRARWHPKPPVFRAWLFLAHSRMSISFAKFDDPAGMHAMTTAAAFYIARAEWKSRGSVRSVQLLVLRAWAYIHARREKRREISTRFKRPVPKASSRLRVCMCARNGKAR